MSSLRLASCQLRLSTCDLPVATCELARATCDLAVRALAVSGQQKVFHFDGDGIGPGRFVFGFAAQAKRG